MAGKVEKEIKLIAPDAEALRDLGAALKEICKTVEDQGTVLVRDAYYDTEDWRLYRAGFACRVRRAGDRTLLCLKALTRQRAGFSARQEIEQRVPAPAPRRLDRLPAGAAVRKLRQIVEEEPTRLLFRLRNKRRVFVAHSDGAKVQVSGDDFTVIAAGRRKRMAEVEIELMDGPEQALRGLARRLKRRMPLRTGTRAKFREGLLLSGRQPLT